MPMPSKIILELVEADKTIKSVVLPHLIDHLDFNHGPRLKICTCLCLRFLSVSLPLWTIAIQGILCCGCPLSLFYPLSVRILAGPASTHIYLSLLLDWLVALDRIESSRLASLPLESHLSIKAPFARVVPHPTAIGPQFIVIGSFGFTSSSLSSSVADAPQLDHRRSLQEYILISMPLVPQSPFIGSFGCISSSSSSSFADAPQLDHRRSLQEFSASSVVSFNSQELIESSGKSFPLHWQSELLCCCGSHHIHGLSPLEFCVMISEVFNGMVSLLLVNTFNKNSSSFTSSSLWTILNPLAAFHGYYCTTIQIESAVQCQSNEQKINQQYQSRYEFNVIELTLDEAKQNVDNLSATTARVDQLAYRLSSLLHFVNSRDISFKSLSVQSAQSRSQFL
ncbi:hypothetical protein MIR68_012215 [Amoeboaphelidium protococcarum]|nr:hypothetical protein MIR68_012215 [Amoeboaphelidium protococcarum]